MLFNLLVLLSMAAKACEPGKNCGDNKICINIEKNQTECHSILATAPLTELILPFSKSIEVVCTHSAGIGGHSWKNALFALDLAVEYNLPSPDILAAADGRKIQKANLSWLQLTTVEMAGETTSKFCIKTDTFLSIPT